MGAEALGWVIIAGVIAAMIGASLAYSFWFKRLTPAEQEKRRKRWSDGRADRGGGGGGTGGCSSGCGGGGCGGGGG